MPVWTESQKRAIETQNRSLLVGAGAGSGKTTVLTERILRRLVGGGSVDRLLVVTFTKSAAADMKEKLYAALSRAIAARPNDRHLRSQLYRLSGARICTIHSFCYELIRRNFASLGLSPKVRVADSAECAILSKRCITETLEHFYETGGDDFFALLGNFDSEKSDEPFVKLLLSCYDRIRAYPDYLGFLDQVAAGLEDERDRAAQDGVFATAAGRIVRQESARILERTLEKARALLDFVSTVAVSERNIAPIEALADGLETLSGALEQGYDAFRDALGGFAPPRLYTLQMDVDAAELLKKGKTEIVDSVRKLQKDCYALPEADAAADFAATARLFRPLVGVLRDYDARFSAAKRERRLVDFSDLEHLTARLLAERHEEGYVRTPLCRKLQDAFDEICIDEYQDVNRLQDLIFSSVSKADNRFMVGDVKQSIYRFRNAEPEIFESYRRAYDGGVAGETVFLRENFRCNRCITEFVNAVLTPVYTPENTGSDYASEALIFAKPGPDDRLPVQAALCVLDEEEKQADGVAAGEPGEGDVCAKGFYTVGPQGQIPAGLYYLEGSNEKLSHYYVFDGDDGRYSLDDSVQYFGNYFVDLDEGDLIVFDPGDEATMYPAPSTSTNPTAPYTNGCYRVGIDIPAGSYTITAATVGEGETDEDSAAFVMKNLDFDDDSIVDTKYVIPGGEQTVTVSNGQYLELFAATATPVAQG